MHLLANCVLTLVILPLGLSCESANIENKVAEDYRNVIEPRLKHIKDKIDQLNLNCTPTMLREPEKTQSILQKMCRINGQLRRINHRMQSEAINSRPDFPDLRLLVEDINNSLSCWCYKKHGQREHSKQPPLRKWKFCKVKYILAALQTCFEQYNASQSVNTELPKRGKTLPETSKQTWPSSIS